MNKTRLGKVLLATGLFLMWFEALLVDASHGIFRSDAFAERLAGSLGDPNVSGFVAGKITDAVIAQRPDLIAVRPILSSATEGLVQSAPFRAIAKQGLQTAHATVFSRGSEQVLLSAPDVGILLRSALAGASPQLAAKIPDKVSFAAARLEKSRAGAVLARARVAWERTKWLTRILIFVAPILILAGVWLHADRRSGLIRAGLGLIAVGLLIGLLVPMGRVVAMYAVPAGGPARAALFGLWRAYFLGLFAWAATLAGSGVVLAAAGTSLYEGVAPIDRLRSLIEAAVHRPESRGGRLLWALLIALAGTIVLIWPTSVLVVIAVSVGLLLIYMALGEIFRLALEGVPHGVEDKVMGTARFRLSYIIVLALLMIGGILFWWRPTESFTAEVTACNGSPVLCDRRVDQVVFPAAHNAMSNAGAVGWMFPHHGKAIPEMLDDGIRALLLDVHYGLQGTDRVKTDFDKELVSREKIEGAIGPEGTAAALRIRDRIVLGENPVGGLYFCHGFCELGAYSVVPTLKQVRDFLVGNPNEVLILVVEDYITTEDLRAAFDEAGLLSLVDTAWVKPPWPTLRELIVANQRLIVFIESGRPGVSWFIPTVGMMQETPYTFHKPEDFSCRPNRGGTEGSLFQINHWIETTPAPKPTNAAIVNAYDFLLKRAEQCQKERGHLPNVIAVDFYDVGDLFRVARTLNGLSGTTRAAGR